MMARSCSPASPTCGGAAPTWCSNPRAPVRCFRLCDADIAATIAGLSAPQTMRQLRRKRGFPGVELLGLLVDCGILFVVDPDRDKGLRSSEGDPSLVLWDFHDLLFHARSTAGRHANPSGGVMAYAHVVEALPAVRPPWPGAAIDLRKAAGAFAGRLAGGGAAAPAPFDAQL